MELADGRVLDGGVEDLLSTVLVQQLVQHRLCGGAEVSNITFAAIYRLRSKSWTFRERRGIASLDS